MVLQRRAQRRALIQPSMLLQPFAPQSYDRTTTTFHLFKTQWPGNGRGESRPIFPANLVLRGYAPVAGAQRLGRVSPPCLVVWCEVTLFFHHRRNYSYLFQTHVRAGISLAFASQPCSVRPFAGEGARATLAISGQGTGSHGWACALRIRTSTTRRLFCQEVSVTNHHWPCEAKLGEYAVAVLVD
jgi:hypothetical protein